MKIFILHEKYDDRYIGITENEETTAAYIIKERYIDKNDMYSFSDLSEKAIKNLLKIADKKNAIGFVDWLLGRSGEYEEVELVNLEYLGNSDYLYKDDEKIRLEILKNFIEKTISEKEKEILIC
jgi:hypothetical protein